MKGKSPAVKVSCRLHRIANLLMGLNSVVQAGDALQ